MAKQRPIRIEFELDSDDLEYFRERLRSAQEKFGTEDEASIIAGAEALANRTTGSKLPEFMENRLDVLRQMIAMLRDADWRLEGEDRKHVLNALTYFADPEDLIPDAIPGIGLLDDAIMIDLAANELRPELDAFEEFCENREELASGAEDAEPLNVARDLLQNRMRRQRRRAARRDSGRSSSYTLFRA
ncbi:MAG: YkvA family protein [Pseudomonadota bacterium]